MFDRLLERLVPTTAIGKYLVIALCMITLASLAFGGIAVSLLTKQQSQDIRWWPALDSSTKPCTPGYKDNQVMHIQLGLQWVQTGVNRNWIIIYGGHGLTTLNATGDSLTFGHNSVQVIDYVQAGIDPYVGSDAVIQLPGFCQLFPSWASAKSFLNKLDKSVPINLTVTQQSWCQQVTYQSCSHTP